VWFQADRVGGTRGRRARNIAGKASQQLARAVLVEVEQEMFETSVAMRNHQMDQLGTRRYANDLCAFRTQTVLTGFTPIHQDVEAAIVAPQRDQRVALAIGAAAKRDDCVRESSRGKAFGTG